MAYFDTLPNEVFEFENYNPNLPAEAVFTFLIRIPNIIELFIDNDFSNFNEVSRERNFAEVLSENLLFEIFITTREQLLVNVNNLRNSIRSNASFTEEFTRRLATIGFAGNSLALKFRLLNYRWNQATIEVKRSSNKRFDFRNRFFLKPLKKFLEYLNSILGSLASVIPGVDGIKEFKELIENHPALDD